MQGRIGKFFSRIVAPFSTAVTSSSPWARKTPISTLFALESLTFDAYAERVDLVLRPPPAATSWARIFTGTSLPAMRTALASSSWQLPFQATDKPPSS
jgi:hypothetical protein